MDILDRVKPLKWQSALLASNLDLHNRLWEDTVDYFKKLEVCVTISKNPTKPKEDPKCEQTKKNSDHNNNKHSKKCQCTTSCVATAI